MHNNPLLLSYELSVLENCIRFHNLSIASEHVGISQPQLSRIVKKIESELEVTLIDRSSKRQSRWTEAAVQLAEEFKLQRREFREALMRKLERGENFSLRIGCLEGLGGLATSIAHTVLEQKMSQQVEVQVYDLNELSKKFQERELDLLLTSRSFGQKKFLLYRTLGYQKLKIEDKGSGEDALPMNIVSPTQKSLSPEWMIDPAGGSPTFISNSLWIRQLFFKTWGGRGQFPGQLMQSKPRKSEIEEATIVEPVFLIGEEGLSPKMLSFLRAFDPFPSR